MDIELPNISNYKDTVHYHQKYNSMMLNWMKNQENEINQKNIENYIKEITKKASEYPLGDIADQINIYLDIIDIDIIVGSSLELESNFV